MNSANEPTLPALPIVNTVGDLNAVMINLIDETSKRYQIISEEQNAHQNIEASNLFLELANAEKARLNDFHAQINSDSSSQGDNHKLFLSGQRAGLIRDSQENPYLLTTYRALQLIVNDKLWMFEYLSEISSNTADANIRQMIEKFALEELELAAQFRKKRRVAYHQEKNKQSSLLSSPQSNPATTPEAFALFIDDANSSIHDIISVIEQRKPDEVSQNIHTLFRTLRNKLKVESGPNDSSRTHPDHHQTTLFSSLKALLSEIETACDMSLEIAESSQNELVVENAQESVEIYVEMLAAVRDELYFISNKPSAP